MKILVAPSILSADFSRLEREIKSVERAGADMLHIDVMDGHFVPNITIGPVVVKHIRKATRLPLDVHLMISRPQYYTDRFIEAGSDMITWHIEAIRQPMVKGQYLKIKRKGVRFGLSLNPATPLSAIRPFLGYIDFVLVMSVNPGFGGQEFMPSVIPKIRQLRKVFKKDISVDGGINHEAARLVIGAGANILASGSYIFGSKNRKAAIERIRNAGD